MLDNFEPIMFSEPLVAIDVTDGDYQKLMDHIVSLYGIPPKHLLPCTDTEYSWAKVPDQQAEITNKPELL